MQVHTHRPPHNQENEGPLQHHQEASSYQDPPGSTAREEDFNPREQTEEVAVLEIGTEDGENAFFLTAVDLNKGNILITIQIVKEK